MKNMQKVFQKKKPFIGYLTAGDGDTVSHAFALEQGGIDILELGVPFSDPIADGTVIQMAMERALKNGTTPHSVLEIAKNIRKKSEIPLVLFSYLTPILELGETYLKEAKGAGIDAVLIVDLPIEHAKSYAKFMKKIDLDTVFLLSSSTDIERVKEINSFSTGFLYYVMQKGTTGEKAKIPKDAAIKMEKIKEVTSLPVVAGFGICSKETAKEAYHIADGFVVGSHFVKHIENKKSPEELTKIAMEIDPRR